MSANGSSARPSAPGDPASSPRRSLLAERLHSGHPLVFRSFRFHRPRGGFCARGYCQQCAVIDGYGRKVLACEVIAEGFGGRWRVSREFDLLRVIGRFAERYQPWFYEKRLLRPSWLRKTYLEALRRLSSALPFSDVPTPSARMTREIECQALVVGGGRAGIAAALELETEGREVILLERETLGGIARCHADLAGELSADIELLRTSRVVVHEHTECFGYFAEEGLFAAWSGDGLLKISTKELIVATGAYDRLVPFPRNDLPGIVGLRAFERLAAQGGLRARMAIGIYGAAEEVDRACRAARAAGLAPAWVAGPATEYLSEATTVVADVSLLSALGPRRLTGVRLGDGSTRPCDMLVLAFSQPTYELQIQTGLTPTVIGEPATILPHGTPELPTLVIGEAAGWISLDHLGEQARQAVRQRRSSLQSDEGPSLDSAIAGASVTSRARESIVCPCEDIRLGDLVEAINSGFADVELLKRRTGVCTGPCQGKLCLPEVAATLRDCGHVPKLPTNRTPIRPVPLAALAAGSQE